MADDFFFLISSSFKKFVVYFIQEKITVLMLNCNLNSRFVMLIILLQPTSQLTK